MGIAVAKKKTGPKPKPEGPRDALIAVKCWAAYKSWVEDFAKHLRITPSQLVDHSLMSFAEIKGFDPPPER